MALQIFIWSPGPLRSPSPRRPDRHVCNRVPDRERSPAPGPAPEIRGRLGEREAEGQVRRASARSVKAKTESP